MGPELSGLVIAWMMLINSLAWQALRGREFLRKYLPESRLTMPVMVFSTALLGLCSFGLQGSSGRPEFTAAGTILVSLAWLPLLIDAKTLVLPDPITLLMAGQTGAALFLLGALVLPVQAGLPWSSVLQWVLFALGGGMLWALVCFVGWKRGQMGFGDLKLAPVLGTLLGMYSPLLSVFGLALALLSAGVFAAVRLALRRRGSKFPFGPHLVLAALASWAVVTIGPYFQSFVTA